MEFNSKALKRKVQTLKNSFLTMYHNFKLTNRSLKVSLAIWFLIFQIVIICICSFFLSTNILIFETFQWSEKGPIWCIILLLYFSFSNYHYVFRYKFFNLHLDLISCISCIHLFTTSKWIFFCFSHIFKICNF
jgi:hypothetical protein